MATNKRGLGCVIGVDLYGDGWAEIIRRYDEGSKPWMAEVLRPLRAIGPGAVSDLVHSLQLHGALLNVQVNLKEYKDRFFPIKGDFLEVMDKVKACASVDVIYLDADKSEELIAKCVQMFPNAVICGDDWTWGEEQGFPVQRIVKQICHENSWGYEAKRATWVIKK